MPVTRSRSASAESPADSQFDAVHRARVPAWLGSVMLHAILFVLAGLAWKAAPHGVTGGGDRPAGIALADLRTDRPQYFYSSATTNPSSAEGATASASSALPANPQSAANNLPGLPTAAEVANDAGAGIGLSSTGELTTQGQPVRGIGGETSTGVFGAVGTGSKFIYVFDRSASMADLGGRPIAAAKSQLMESLNQLSEIHQFQIVFYNEEPHIFNPHAPSTPRMIYGDDQSKRAAANFIDAITPAGGTRHWNALKLALNMRPDVIFFLTDGTAEPITQSQAAQIQRATERSGTSINVIEFGSGHSSGTLFLKRLAQQCHGQYVYVDVTQLKLQSDSGQ